MRVKKLVLIGILLAAPPAIAAGPETESGTTDSANAGAAAPAPDYSDLAKFKVKIDFGDPNEAITDLQAALTKAPEDPNILSLLGYGSRKIEKWHISRDYYQRALAVEPAHRDALEYMAELELETGNFDAARALMVRLQDACPKGCNELKLLHKAFRKAGVALAENSS